VLAATLASAYGLYGPAFELMEHEPREPGSEEYRASEKYQLRDWAAVRAERGVGLEALIARVNRIRREHPALHGNASLRFLPIDNRQMLAYAKHAPAEDGDDVIVIVVNLDPWQVQAGWLELDLTSLGIAPEASYQMHDLLNDARYLWSGARNFVRVDPARGPAHLFVLRQRLRSEHDFDYFL